MSRATSQMIYISSPDPTLCEGKDFGQKAWSSWRPAKESQSDCSFISVIWLANHMNVKAPLPAVQIWIAYAALLTKQIWALFKGSRAGACTQSWPNQENGSKSLDHFPRRGCGQGTRLTSPELLWHMGYWLPNTFDNDRYVFFRY